MRVALPIPFRANPFVALGADYSSHRLFEKLRTHAEQIEFELLPIRGGYSGFWLKAEHHSPLEETGSSGHFRPDSWDLLQDVRPRGDPRRFFRLRSAVGRSFSIVLTHHSLCYPEYLGGFFAPLLLAGCQAYDAVVCTSQASRKAFEELLKICAQGIARVSSAEEVHFEGQLPVIPNGVDTDLFRPRDTGDVRHQLGLSPDAFVMLWIGRLSAESKADLHPLLGVLRLLVDRNPERKMMLVLVGTDAEGYGRAIDKYAAGLGLSSEVRIERVRPETPIHLWYSAADVFVSPVDNVQETFGNAPIEAMAAGVPQVVSDWDGYRDTVSHGVTGFRARTVWGECDSDAIEQWAFWGDSQGCQALLAQTVACDTGELLAYLERLMRSDELRAEMARASRQRALSEYAWPVVVRRYTECWSELVSRQQHLQPLPEPTGILPAFFRTFAGYASCVLSGQTRVRRRPDAVRSSLRPQAEQELDRALVSQYPSGIERVLAVLSETGGEMTVGALSDMLGAEGVSGASVYRAVLLGAKYGLVEVL